MATCSLLLLANEVVQTVYTRREGCLDDAEAREKQRGHDECEKIWVNAVHTVVISK